MPNKDFNSFTRKMPSDMKNRMAARSVAPRFLSNSARISCCSSAETREKTTKQFWCKMSPILNYYDTFFQLKVLASLHACRIPSFDFDKKPTSTTVDRYKTDIFLTSALRRCFSGGPQRVPIQREYFCFQHKRVQQLGRRASTRTAPHSRHPYPNPD